MGAYEAFAGKGVFGYNSNYLNQLSKALSTHSHLSSHPPPHLSLHPAIAGCRSLVFLSSSLMELLLSIILICKSHRRYLKLLVDFENPIYESFKPSWADENLIKVTEEKCILMEPLIISSACSGLRMFKENGRYLSHLPFDAKSESLHLAGANWILFSIHLIIYFKIKIVRSK